MSESNGFCVVWTNPEESCFNFQGFYHERWEAERALSQQRKLNPANPRFGPKIWTEEHYMKKLKELSN